MTRRLTVGWAILAAVVPLFVGALLVFNPSSFLPPEAQVPELARLLGLRNFGLSIVMIVALLIRSWPAVAFLVMARGAQEIADAIASLAATGQVGGAAGPFIAGLVSIGVGYLLYTHARGVDSATDDRPRPAPGSDRFVAPKPRP
jgi:hypothetical protein